MSRSASFDNQTLTALLSALSNAVPAAYARVFVVSVIGLGLLCRLATVSSPIFEFHAWRQADTAAIARNFVEERFHPFYPQIDQRGSRDVGYVETGLELYAFVVAAIARLTGFAPALGRVVNVLLFPFAAILLFRFVRDRYGESAAYIALFVYALGMPLVMFLDRAFMNEALLLCLTIGCLRAAQLYLRQPGARSLIALVTASTLIAVIKPTFLIVWVPIGGLFLERFGVRAFWRPELWLTALVNAACALLWFRHAHTLYATTGLTFGIGDKLFAAEYLHLEYASKVATRLLKDILGPVGVACGSYGLVVAIRGRRLAEPLAVAAFLVYLVVVTPGNFHHNYYQVPIAPVGAVLTGLGVATALARMAKARQWTQDQRLYAMSAVLGVALLTTFVRSVSAHNWYEIDHARVELCEELSAATSPDDRVVFANYLSPDVLFCIDRYGWLLAPEETTMEKLQGLASEGARVFVTSRDYPETVEALRAIGPPLVSTRRFVAHRVP